MVLSLPSAVFIHHHSLFRHAIIGHSGVGKELWVLSCTGLDFADYIEDAWEVRRPQMTNGTPFAHVQMKTYKSTLSPPILEAPITAMKLIMDHAHP